MTSLSLMLKRFIQEYSDEYAEVKRTGQYARPFGNFVRHEIPNLIETFLESDNYSVVGSVGKGRWTLVPWIAIFDTRITSSAQKGVYIVYLLNKDTKKLYLTFNQGATGVTQNSKIEEGEKLTFTGVASSGNKQMAHLLEKRARDINAVLGHYDGLIEAQSNSGSLMYDAGCIYYKCYELTNLPNDKELIRDLNQFIKVYKAYYDKFEKKQENVEISISSLDNSIESISLYINNKGFKYPKGLIENLYLSIVSKPFVILAGISGTGKTKLVKLFAEAIGAEYQMIPVRPDWSDGSDLFGHYDLNGNFKRGPICESFDKAIENPDRPVFVCLDEMNLARVEYYFSDMLSVIESREKDEYGKIRTAPIAQYSNGIPENLYIIGTVNMDETTFPFSKKVLDRANTIEFNDVDLIPEFSEVSMEEYEPIELPNSALKSQHLVLAKDCIDEQEYVRDICTRLQEINDILTKSNSHVGYRVRDEIVFYMLNNKNSNFILSEEDAFDNEIMQKILPRIQGSSIAVKDMLCELFEICGGKYEDRFGDSDSDKMKNILNDSTIECKYKNSARKIELMVRRFEEDGFTSYWL